MKEPKDPRSTGRKRARAALAKSGRPYECECREDHAWHYSRQCKWTPKQQSRSDSLDVNHISKDILDCDPVNLQYLCRKCHREVDRRTKKGVIDNSEFNYGQEFL